MGFVQFLPLLWKQQTINRSNLVYIRFGSLPFFALRLSLSLSISLLWCALHIPTIDKKTMVQPTEKKTFYLILSAIVLFAELFFLDDYIFVENQFRWFVLLFMHICLYEYSILTGTQNDVLGVLGQLKFKSNWLRIVGIFLLFSFYIYLLLLAPCDPEGNFVRWTTLCIRSDQSILSLKFNHIAKQIHWRS